MFDPDVADTSHTVTLTNGAKQWSELPETTLFLLFLVNSWWFRVVQIGIFYRISSYTDANNITLNSNFALATGVTTWKSSEVGLTGGKTSALTCQVQMQTDMTSIFLAKCMKTLFLAVKQHRFIEHVTDTVTTDASPAFTMPTGFDCLAIHRGSNGILMGQFSRKGYLVLWDNYSDRAIAP